MNKIKIKHIRLTLDIIMLLVSLTIYNKRFFNMNYHEVAGLILCGIIVVHIGINFKMMLAMVKNYTRVPVNLKLGLIIDILLIISYAFIGISGVAISKTILTNISIKSGIMKIGHFFAGGLSIILLGIHISLHIYKKPLKLPIAIGLTILFLIFGGLGVVKTEIPKYLSTPFTIASNQNKMPQGEEMSEGKEKMERPPKDMGEGGKNTGDLQKGKGGMPSMGNLERLLLALYYFGMIGLVSTIVYWIGRYFEIKKSKALRTS